MKQKRLPLIFATGLVLALSAVVVPTQKHNPYSSRDLNRAFQVGPRLTGLYGDDLGEESFGALGGSPSNLFPSFPQLRPIEPGLYEITFPFTGTDWQETFLFGLPSGPLQPAPLLTVFHGYGERPEDVLANTDYVQLARSRGWYVLVPLAAHEYNFGIEYAQRNVELALNWVARAVPLDVRRLYAVGFSMGGALSMNYPARHQDLYGGRFAAVINHTGVTSLQHSFATAIDDRLFLSPLMFGATPEQAPFAYSSVTSMDLSFDTGQVNQNTDMLRNLVGTPVYSFAAFQDPVTTLLEQTDAFEVQFGNRGGALTTNRGSNAIHDWTTLDENAALNWLAQFELQDPAAYTTHNLLADRSARWHAFYLAQTEPGRFTPFSYQFQPGQNRVYTIAQGNLSRISFYPSTLALRTSDPLEWVIANTEVEPIDMVLYGVNAMPIDVERNGQSVVNWAYDPVLRQLTLKENDATSVPTWRIYF